ncbi:MAG: hypothetical protein N2561_00900 [Bacteroidetes bacterium]|nr:hypothetical protein [Rhodothermia bacterium]MCS7155814.1 hypothetical protein [Bacteroidota bacterium]MCX7906085.1 hypothetical protein [Bacteroidota bacterium]MDW8138213.1 hypothetical protein [Bacteroidota bacterium]MDW8285897.1 hypothetical protein [Bacteroidota bacterium]
MSFEELLFWALVLYWVWVFLFRGRQRAPQEAPAPQAPRRRHAEAVEEALQEIRRALAELTLEAEPAPSLPAPTAERVEERFRWTEGAIQEASFERGRFFDSEPPPEKKARPSVAPPLRLPPSPQLPPLRGETLRWALWYREVLGPPRALRPWRPHWDPWEPRP